MSNNWDVTYMRKIAGLPLCEWDSDQDEAQIARAEATESGIERYLKQLQVSLPLTSQAAEQVAEKIEQMSNDTGYGSTISIDDVLDYLDAKNAIVSSALTNEMRKVAGLPLVEEDDPDVAIANRDLRQREFERRNKSTIGKKRRPAGSGSAVADREKTTDPYHRPETKDERDWDRLEQSMANRNKTGWYREAPPSYRQEIARKKS